MARLPPPLPPPRRPSSAHSLRPTAPSLAPVTSTIAPLDDEASLAKTVERRPARPAAAMLHARIEACILQVRLTMTELLRDPRGAIGAAVWTACVVAGVTGVLLGHHRPSRVHAARHDSVVLEAREEITELPVLASAKETAADGEAPAPDAVATETGATAVEPAIARVARPKRRAGFGHLGADRVASGASARTPAHRR